jgi:hypothetical protein
VQLGNGNALGVGCQHFDQLQSLAVFQAGLSRPAGATVLPGASRNASGQRQKMELAEAKLGLLPLAATTGPQRDANWSNRGWTAFSQGLRDRCRRLVIFFLCPGLLLTGWSWNWYSLDWASDGCSS